MWGEPPSRSLSNMRGVYGVESTLDWDANCDIAHFQIGIWRYTEAGGIETVRTLRFNLQSGELP